MTLCDTPKHPNTRSYNRSLGARLSLARRILAIHASQPATALWRVFEVEAVLEQLQGEGRGLDLGCGDGTLGTILFQGVPGIQWTGLDIDPEDAALAEPMYARVYVASAAAIPEPDGAFDLVFSNSALEHMPEMDAVLTEVHRVLRPGGRLAFTVPEAAFRDQLFWPRLLRTFGLTRMADEYVRSLDIRVAHVNYLSPQEWQDRLARCGFHTDVQVSYLSRRAIGGWETLSNLTGGLAYLLFRGRKTPRQIQRSTGLVTTKSSFLGTLAYVALLPVLILIGMEQHPRNCGALYIEATKRG
jgi:SAM-dependent methyltransferase